jgi:hypothetical protein
MPEDATGADLRANFLAASRSLGSDYFSVPYSPALFSSPPANPGPLALQAPGMPAGIDLTPNSTDAARA